MNFPLVENKKVLKEEENNMNVEIIGTESRIRRKKLK